MKHVTITPKNIEFIGDVLREVRAEMQISQEDVARKMGKRQPFISSLESNRKKPSLPTLMNYLKAINCKLIIVIE